MKVALACDYLIEKNYQTKVLESLVLLFPDSEVFTLVHKVGSVAGPIEQRKIHSSFLSHFVKNEDDFWKWSLVAPGAANNLHIPCSFDLIICIGSGFASMISHCKTTPKISYLLSDHKWWPEKKGMRDKLFRSFVKSSVDKGIKDSRVIVSANENIFDVKTDAPKEVMFPPVKIDRFPLFGKEQRKLLKASYWLIDESSYDATELGDLISTLKENQVAFRLLKANEQDGNAKGEYLGDDHLAPVMANSKGILIGSKKIFSDLAIKSLACGRPVIMSAQSGLSFFFSDSEGTAIYGQLTDLMKWISHFDAEEYRPEKVRGQAMKFNDIKFKIGWNKYAEGHANKVIEN